MNLDAAIQIVQKKTTNAFPFAIAKPRKQVYSENHGNKTPSLHVKDDGKMSPSSLMFYLR